MRTKVLLFMLLVGLAGQTMADDVLRIGTYGIPKTLGNPHSSTSISEVYTWSAIFDTLTEVDEQGQVLPALALSWEAVDELTWIFSLRPDVKFSNARAFDAEAVAVNVNWLVSPAAVGESLARELGAIQSARVIDELSVEITTRWPTLILPAMLAGLRIAEPDLWRSLGPAQFARQPVGTGAFMVERWRAARVDLVANPHAWRPPRVARLELYEILDPSTRLQGVQSGRLDIGLHITPDDIGAVERSGGSMHVGESAGVSGMTFISVKDGPLSDVRVRRALNYAVDKTPIIEILLAGHARIPSQPAPHYVPGWNPELQPYPYDPDMARRLLAEAGYPEGFAFTVEVVTSGTTAAAAVYQFIAQQLTRVGVRMEIRPLPISQLIQKAISGQWDGHAFHMEFDLKPSLDPMRAVPMHSCQRAVPWHCDEALMPLIEAAQREFDPERRQTLVREVMRAYHENPPMLYLWESVHFDGLSSRVRNYHPRNRLINYHEISVDAR